MSTPVEPPTSAPAMVSGRLRPGPPPGSASPDIQRSFQFLDTLFESTPPEQVGFRLWDGRRWPDERPRAATLRLNHPAALREMFAAGTEKALAEAYLREDFDIEGDMEAAFEIADILGRRRAANWASAVRTYYHLHRLPARREAATPDRMFSEPAAPKHSPRRDRQAVSFHYDLSNDFYRFWLDPQMLYSCAYFESAGASLDEAQEAKLRHLCRKLRLRPGQRLLDIGCGWGALAMHAARHHGVKVTGVTLSERQVELATERVRAAGLERDVGVELKDYREIRGPESFDAIVSVGMSEHVGTDQLAGYFKAAGALLKPGGVFLNHAISEGAQPRARVGPSFIDAYVFPDSDIPPIPVVLRAAESAGLEVRDVENLREHYALTLRHWFRRLEAAQAEARRFVDETTYRIWRLYLAGSAHGFARGHLAVYQALLAKPDASGRSFLPLTRGDWYAGG